MLGALNTPAAKPCSAANVAAALKNIPKGQNDVKVTLTPTDKAALGSFPVTFTGKAKVQSKEFTVTAP